MCWKSPIRSGVVTGVGKQCSVSRRPAVVPTCDSSRGRSTGVGATRTFVHRLMSTPNGVTIEMNNLNALAFSVQQILNPVAGRNQAQSGSVAKS